MTRNLPLTRALLHARGIKSADDRDVARDLRRALKRASRRKGDAHRLRVLLAVGDQLGWEQGDPAADEIEIPGDLLKRFLEQAWEAGNEMMGRAAARPQSSLPTS